MFKNKKIIWLFLVFCVAIIMPVVNAHWIDIKFYDENSRTILDGNVVITDYTHSATYYADANGDWNRSLDTLSWSGNDVNVGIKRVVSGTTTHSERYLQFYFGASSNYAYYFMLMPNTLTNNIEFLVKDINGNVWNDKYLQFVSNNDTNFTYNRIIEPSFETITGWVYSETDADYGGGQSTNWKTDGNYSYYFDGRNAYISPNAYAQITRTVNLSGIHYLLFDAKTVRGTTVADFNEQILINGIIVWNKNIYDENTYIDNNIDCSSYQGDYNITIRVINTSGSQQSLYENSFFYIDNLRTYYYIQDNNYPILFGSHKTDSSGYTTANINPSGDYNADLYDANGNYDYTYQKTNVTAYKPLDEKTLASISPYDITVGGLLNYTLSNQTASSVAFNIFAGTVDYYNMSVVDYNSDIANRLYIPRNYKVLVPFGEEYSSTYLIQPYLLSVTDGIIPSFYVENSFLSPISNVIIDVIKYINNQTVVVESGVTDSSGKISFSAYPTDNYYFNVYYDSILMGTFNFVPRESTDTFYVVIDPTSIPSYNAYNIINLNFDMNDSVYYNSDLNYKFDLYAMNYENITSIKISWVQNDNTIDSDTNLSSLNNYDTNFSGILSHTGITTTNLESYLIIDINYTYEDVNYTTRFTKSIGILENENPTVFNLLHSIGESHSFLTIILSLILTVIILFLLINSGINMSTTSIVLIGELILGFFVFINWLSSGVYVFGTDIVKFIWVITLIGSIYLLYKGADVIY